MTDDPPTTTASTDEPEQATGPASSRRKFLGMAVAGIGAAAAVPAIASAQTDEPVAPEPGDGRRGDRRRGGRPGDGRRNRDGDQANAANLPEGFAPDRFTRMFDLPPFARPST
ncbi:MAG: twin-arginine translocation signal domain-containing protein, partial [Ilumatobacteraceae bacterium]